MYSFSEMQSTATSLFTAYASLAASTMLVRSMANEFIPSSFRSYIYSAVGYLFTPLSNELTIVIDEQSGMTRNQVYDSADIYLSKKISPTTSRFKVNKTPKQKSINLSLEKNQEIIDVFRGIQLKWRFVLIDAGQNQMYTTEKRFFELSFKKKHKDTVLNDYLSFVIEKSRHIRDNDRVVKLYTRDVPCNGDDYNEGSVSGVWGSIVLDHPATFQTLAMDPTMKRAIIEDLDRFIKRRDYYKKVGKAWKRGYLLYGPPGTGKSTLVAAMANYLKFDIYDLELTSIYSNSELRRILVSTTNRSIVVMEDIDCSVEMHDRQLCHDPSSSKLTLSGLLNFIDGLWSCCGDERIIIFTTNYKDKLDPALLRPGRMDMHIHMSYCTPQGFKILALNYLGIHDHDHGSFGEIESLIEGVEVTPAELAEELMRSEDVDVAMEGVVNFLKRKRDQVNEVKDEKCAMPKGEEVVEEENENKEEVGDDEAVIVKPKRRKTLRSCVRSRPLGGRGGFVPVNRGKFIGAGFVGGRWL